MRDMRQLSTAVGGGDPCLQHAGQLDLAHYLVWVDVWESVLSVDGDATMQTSILCCTSVLSFGPALFRPSCTCDSIWSSPDEAPGNEVVLIGHMGTTACLASEPELVGLGPGGSLPASGNHPP